MVSLQGGLRWDGIVRAFQKAFAATAASIATAFAEIKAKAEKKRAEEKAKGENAKDPTTSNQMQKQVESGKAPREVDRVDKPHVKGQQPHIHFKDGTSLNQDGTVHDAHKGMPNLNNKVKNWLTNNNWKVNG